MREISPLEKKTEPCFEPGAAGWEAQTLPLGINYSLECWQWHKWGKTEQAAIHLETSPIVNNKKIPIDSEKNPLCTSRQKKTGCVKRANSNNNKEFMNALHDVIVWRNYDAGLVLLDVFHPKMIPKCELVLMVRRYDLHFMGLDHGFESH